MGYIFDAIHRADRDAPPAPPAPSPPPETPLDEAPLAGAHPLPPDHTAYPSASPPDRTPGPDDAPQPLAFVAEGAGIAGDIDPGIDDRLVALTEPGSMMTEEYRSIRTTLLARCEHRRHLVHTITSATPQEGKTITSLNLGLSFGELRNRSTLVVEADLRLPTFAGLLNLGECRGLVHLLRGEASLAEVIQRVPGTRLDVIPAGERCGAEAIQLLTGQPMAELLKALRKRFDHVVVDTPPVTELADAGILGALSDEVMLVVRMGQTPRPLIEQAVRTLRGYHAPVAGVIATDQQRLAGHAYRYRYGYRYQYQHRQAA